MKAGLTATLSPASENKELSGELFGGSDFTIVRILRLRSVRSIWNNDSSSDHVQTHLRVRVEPKLGLSSFNVLPVRHLHLNDLVDLLHLQVRMVG